MGQFEDEDEDEDDDKDDSVLMIVAPIGAVAVNFRISC